MLAMFPSASTAPCKKFVTKNPVLPAYTRLLAFRYMAANLRNGKDFSDLPSRNGGLRRWGVVGSNPATPTREINDLTEFHHPPKTSLHRFALQFRRLSPRATAAQPLSDLRLLPVT